MKKYVLVMAVFMSFNSYAECDLEGYADCGETGDVKWYISNDLTTLTISGTGETGNYGEEPNPYCSGCGNLATHRTTAPWKEYTTTVTNIEVLQGVTGLGQSVFEGFDHVTNVVLPDTLESIGKDCFNRTARLTSIDLPDSVSSIGISAFFGSGLTSLAIPNSVTSIQIGTGMYSPNLSKVFIGENITSIDPEAFAFADGRNGSPLTKIYCSNNQKDMCAAAVAYRGENVTIEEYQTDKNGRFFYKNHWYTSVNDIYNNNHIKKRIYTIDEAHRIAGEKNRVSIKYR